MANIVISIKIIITSAILWMILSSIIYKIPKEYHEKFYVQILGLLWWFLGAAIILNLIAIV